MKKTLLLALFIFASNFVFAQCNPPIFNVIVLQNASCYGSCDGIVQASSSDALTYSINPNSSCQPLQTTAGIFQNLGANTYTIVATDANGCTAASTFAITQPTSLSVSAVPTQTPTCTPGCDGEAQATANGGTTPYTYSIFPVFGNIDSLTGKAESLCAGVTYTITTKDMNACTATTTINILTPTNGLVFAVTVLQNGSCSGMCDGIVQASSNDSLTYNIFPNTPCLPVQASSGIFQNLGENTYTVVASDANGCSSTQTISITSAQPFVAISIDTIIGTNCSNCNGKVTVHAFNNTQPILFTIVSSNWGFSTSNSTGQFSGLCSDTYTITATEANCGTASTVIAIPESTNSNNSSISKIYPCPNQCTGEIKMNIPNLSNYSFTINSSFGINQISNGHFTNCCNGIYTITTLDSSGCIATDVVTLFSPYIDNQITQATCVPACNGMMNLSTLGMNLPVTYTINPSSGIIQNTSNQFSGFCNNSTYSVTATDSIGCVQNQIVTMNNSFVLGVNISVSPTTCGLCNGSIQATIYSGTAPFVFSLNNNGTVIQNSTGLFTGLCHGNYSLNITDAQGYCKNALVSVQTQNEVYANTTFQNPTCFQLCNGIINIEALGGVSPYIFKVNGNVVSSNVVSNLCAGTYIIEVIDVNGCNYSTTITLTEPPKLEVSNTIVNEASCGSAPFGSVNADATGGKLPYTFSIQPPYATSIQDSSVFINMNEGEYTITVTDANQCIDTTMGTLIKVYPKIDSLEVFAENCVPGNDAQIIIYTPQSSQSIFFSIDRINWTPFTNFVSLKEGDYAVYARNPGNCEDTAYASIPFANNLKIQDFTITSPSCFGDSNASIQVPNDSNYYELLPSNSGFENLSVGTYTLTGMTPRGCMGDTIITIEEPSPLSMFLDNTEPTFGDCHGIVTALGAGGTEPYSYSFSSSRSYNQPSPNTFDLLCNDTYFITTTDANGCQTTSSIFVSYVPLDDMDFTIEPVPASNVLHVGLSRNVDMDITLIDAFGRKVFHQFVYETSKVEIPISHLANGFYFLMMHIDDQHFSKKVLIRR